MEMWSFSAINRLRFSSAWLHLLFPLASCHQLGTSINRGSILVDPDGMLLVVLEPLFDLHEGAEVDGSISAPPW